MLATKQHARAIVQEWVDAAEGSARPDDYLGKRSTPRHAPWHEPLELRIGTEVVNAKGRDISIEGVGFTCRRRVSRDELIELRHTDDAFWLPIRIRHCTGTIGGYKVGASFLYV